MKARREIGGPSPFSATWFRGSPPTSSYLAAGQLGAVTAKIGTAASASVSYTRDLIGRQTGASSGSSTISTVFNDRDLPVGVTNASNVTGYSYDNAGRLGSRTDLAGVTGYTYDAAGRLKTLADPLTGLTSNYGYDTNGRTKTITTGASTRTFGYDQASRPIADVLTNTAGVVLSTANTFDGLDRLTTRVTGPAGVAGAGTETFAYDQVSRLTGWTDQANIYTSYTWGSTGNRTSAGTASFTHNERDQMKTSTVGGVVTSYTYQPNGALATSTTNGTTTSRSYDGLGKLVQAGTTNYTYDPLGRLTQAGGATLAYAGLESEPVSDGGVLYTRTPNGTINSIKSAGVASVVVLNGHGDLAATINPATGSLVGRRTYDPFGVPVVATTAGRLGYQAQWTDPATSEVHTPARTYNPALARFTSRDTWTLPVTTASATNRYTYANANPVNRTDPSGHADCTYTPNAFGGVAVNCTPTQTTSTTVAGFAKPKPGPKPAPPTPVPVPTTPTTQQPTTTTTTKPTPAPGPQGTPIGSKNPTAADTAENATAPGGGGAPSPGGNPGTTYTPWSTASVPSYTTSTGSGYDPCTTPGDGVTCYPDEPGTNVTPTNGNRTGGSQASTRKPTAGCASACTGPVRQPPATLTNEPRDRPIDGATNPTNSPPVIYTSDVTGDPLAAQGNATPAPEPEPQTATGGTGATSGRPPDTIPCRATNTAPRFVAGSDGIIDTASPALRQQIDDVADSVIATGTPPAGVRQGGLKGKPGVYGNKSGDLPPRPEGYYTESDVWPGTGPRGTERVVVGGSGEVWYTPDHYGTFRPCR